MILQDAISEAKKTGLYIEATRPFAMGNTCFTAGLFSVDYMLDLLRVHYMDVTIGLDPTMWNLRQRYDDFVARQIVDTSHLPNGAGHKRALKNDSEKVRMELLSVPALRAISEVLTFGAKKYASHNWRKGFEWSRLYGAALRHLTAHMDGEDTDPESGLSHLAHLGCCVLFLLEHEIDGLGTDDRYIRNTKGNE